jgi:LemA protein
MIRRRSPAINPDLRGYPSLCQPARRFFNGNVRDYRNKCETFPSNLVARMFGFQAREFFSVPPSVKEVPDVQFAP